MKKYIKPSVESIVLKSEIGLMANSEPEVTENIGAKENDMMFDWDDDEFADLWVDTEKNQEIW